MSLCWNGELGHVGTGNEVLLGKGIRVSWNGNEGTLERGMSASWRGELGYVGTGNEGMSGRVYGHVGTG